MLNAGSMSKICGESSVISYGFAIPQMLLFYDQICYQKAAKIFYFHIEQLFTCNRLKTKKISAHFGKYFSRVEWYLFNNHNIEMPTLTFKDSPISFC